MKSNLFLLATSLFTCTFANEEAGKLDFGCLPCQERCPQATALLIGRVLAQDFVILLANQNLATIQALKSKKKSTIRTTLSIDGVCADSGDMDFLTGLIPLIPVTVINDATLNVSNYYVDAKGRVLVFGTTVEEINGVTYTLQNRFVFEPVLGSCEFLLSEYFITDVACLPGALP